MQIFSRVSCYGPEVASSDDGDLPDWEELVTREVPRVRGFLRTLVPAEHVDDLTQEAFARLQAALVSGKSIENLRAFLFGIVHNLLREFVRSRVNNPLSDLSDITALQIDPRPSSMLAREADRIRLLDAMRSLSMEHQVVLQLSFWEGLKKREIAEVIGVPENTVKSRLDRARKALAKLLGDMRGSPFDPPDSSA